MGALLAKEAKVGLLLKCLSAVDGGTFGPVVDADGANLNLVAANDEVQCGVLAGLEGDVSVVGVGEELTIDGERDGAEARLRNHDAAEATGIALGSVLGGQGQQLPDHRQRRSWPDSQWYRSWQPWPRRKPLQELRPTGCGSSCSRRASP